MRTTAIPAALSVWGFLLAPSPSLAAEKAEAISKADLIIKSYRDPGLEYFRAAEDALTDAGTDIEIKIIKGKWYSAKPPQQRGDILRAVLEGKAVTTGTRRLTEEEKAKGLNDAVLGFYAAVILVHPDAPIDSIDSRKWKVVLKPGKRFTWKDIATDAQYAADQAKASGQNPIDNIVTWAFPDASHAVFARPFVRLGAISNKLIKTFPDREKKITPLTATHIVADYRDRIGIFGYDLVLADKIHPLKPVRLLKVNGVYPNDKTIADGSYPFSSPVTVIFSAKAEKIPDHPVRRMLDFLKSEQAVIAAQEKSLIRKM